MPLPRLREAMRAGSAHEGERHATAEEGLCEREDFLFPEPDIQQGGIDGFVGKERMSLVKRGGRSDWHASEVDQHLLDEVGDEHFVLDNQDAQALQFSHAVPRFSFVHVDPRPLVV